MKHWYVIQVYAGYEEHVRSDLARRVVEAHLEHLFGEILVPSAKMKQFFSEGDALQDQQLFPGYILVEMESASEAFRLVQTCPRVLRFLGGESPAPLSKKEIERILAQMRGEVVLALEKHEFEIGREVEIKSGPFSGFMGVIHSINEHDERLTVMVSIFGRMTPVELSFDQVKR